MTSGVPDNGAEAGFPGAIGLRTYLHTRAMRPWVSRHLGPAVTWLREEHGFFLQSLRRGWLHGSHLDLLVHDAEGRELPIGPVVERLRGGCRDVDVVTVDEESYLRNAERLGALEGVAGPYLPLHPHGTIETLTADRIRGWDQEAERLRSSALARMTGALLATAGADSESTLLHHLVGAFAAVAGTHPAGIEYGCISFRSHVESFLHWNGQGGRIRAALEQRLEAERTSIDAAVAAALSGESDAVATRWTAAAHYVTGLFDAAVATGVLDYHGVQRLAGTDPAAPRIESVFESESFRRPSTLSEFHQEAEATGVTSDPGAWFTTYRVLVNLFYQQLPVLDVSPLTRLYLCLAVSESVDRLTGRSWRDRLEPLKADYQARDLNADQRPARSAAP
ncbi:hypothetical protein [Kitasatospora sp. SUK 42]|uniref:hypothetical protein n=1 Tax=Kitasatospora sp. SUK 42 TaxID=1588882 RepID=UPI0018C96C9C|nr:hypothetical protein [Kitasatospora sp. SUK 42]MBV2153691.1 hypothetical protein [Kitasatospora sp. SUK 42]